MASEEYDALRYRMAKCYLEKVAGMRAKAETCCKLIDSFDEGLSPRGIDYSSRLGVKTSPDPDGVHRAALRRSRSIARWTAELEAANAFLDAAESCISSMPDEGLKTVVAMRYLDGMTWRQVSSYTGMAESSLMHLLKPACIELYDLMPAEFRMPRHPAV